MGGSESETIAQGVAELSSRPVDDKDLDMYRDLTDGRLHGRYPAPGVMSHCLTLPVLAPDCKHANGKPVDVGLEGSESEQSWQVMELPVLLKSVAPFGGLCLHCTTQRRYGGRRAWTGADAAAPGGKRWEEAHLPIRVG